MCCHKVQCNCVESGEGGAAIVEGGEERQPPTVVRGQWSLPAPLVRRKRKRKRKMWKRKGKKKVHNGRRERKRAGEENSGRRLIGVKEDMNNTK